MPQIPNRLGSVGSHTSATSEAHRASVKAAISSQPGIHFAELGRKTALANGALRHHLRCLLREGAIRSCPDGNKIRYFLAEDWEGHSRALTDPEPKLVQLVQTSPGITHDQLRKALRLSRTAADYHVGRAVAARDVMVRGEGRDRRYWPCPEPVRDSTPDLPLSIHPSRAIPGPVVGAEAYHPEAGPTNRIQRSAKVPPR
jgi:DNA-binding transcriptional ArsR family regulator